MASCRTAVLKMPAMALAALAGFAAAAGTAPIAVPAATVPAAQVETVTLCFERANVLPWRTEQLGGLNFALLRMVGQRINIHFDFQSVPWKRCLAQLRNSTSDGAFAVSYSPERRELGAYPGGEHADPAKRMHVDSYMLLRRKGSAVDWDGKTLSRLEGPVGFQLGYSVGDVLRGMKVDVDEGSQRADELARKLIAGRLGAAAMGGSDTAAVMRGPMGARLEVVARPLIEKPYFLVLSHGMMARRPELAQRIWSAMEQVRNSPAYKKLERAALDGGAP